MAASGAQLCESGVPLCACAGATWSRSSSTLRAGSRGGPLRLGNVVLGAGSWCYSARAPPARSWRRRRQYCQGLVDYDQVRAATPQMFGAELTGLKQDQARLQSAEKEVEKTLALVTKLCG